MGILKKKRTGIIAILSQKGGGGKSTLARALSVELTKQKFNTLLIDLDIQQKTSQEWVERRKSQGIKPAINCQSFPYFPPELLKKNYDYLIIDAPARLNKINDYYTYCSNCVVVKEEPKKQPQPNKNKKNWGTAPINETSENIQSLNLDKRTLKKTGRVHLFATRVKKEWIEQLKSIAYEERLHYNEVLEKALETYENQRKSKISNLQRVLKNIEKQVQPLQGQISWKELELRINNLEPTLFNEVGLPITYEVLKETLQEFLRLGQEQSE